MHIMSAVWIGLAAAAVGVVIVLLGGWKRDPAAHDLGTISDQWMAQHRVHSRDPVR
jgi:hypothetical protein